MISFKAPSREKNGITIWEVKKEHFFDIILPHHSQVSLLLLQTSESLSIACISHVTFNLGLRTSLQPGLQPQFSLPQASQSLLGHTSWFSLLESQFHTGWDMAYQTAERLPLSSAASLQLVQGPGSPRQHFRSFSCLFTEQVKHPTMVFEQALWLYWCDKWPEHTKGLSQSWKRQPGTTLFSLPRSCEPW